MIAREETALLEIVRAIGGVRSDAGSAQLAVVERNLSAGAMPALHVHEDDEAFYVVEGTMTIHVGHEVVRLQAGEALLAPKGVPHTYRADSERVCYLGITYVRSIGGYEDFLRGVARPAPGSEPSDPRSWPSPDDETALSSMAAANRIAVLGPPGLLPAG